MSIDNGWAGLAVVLILVIGGILCLKANDLMD